MIDRWVAEGEIDVGVSHVTTRSAAVNVVFSMAAPVHALFRGIPSARGKACRVTRRRARLSPGRAEQGTTIRRLFDLCCATHGKAFRTGVGDG